MMMILKRKPVHDIISITVANVIIIVTGIVIVGTTIQLTIFTVIISSPPSPCGSHANHRRINRRD